MAPKSKTKLIRESLAGDEFFQCLSDITFGSKIYLSACSEDN